MNERYGYRPENHNTKTAYEILGVAKNVTQDDITATFRRLSKELHPDNKHGGDANRYKQVTEAYQKIKTMERRTAYDRTIPDTATKNSAQDGNPFEQANRSNGGQQTRSSTSHARTSRVDEAMRETNEELRRARERAEQQIKDGIRKTKEDLAEARRKYDEAQERLRRSQRTTSESPNKGRQRQRDNNETEREINSFADAFTFSQSTLESLAGRDIASAAGYQVTEKWGLTFGSRGGKIYILENKNMPIPKSSGYDRIQRRGNRLVGVRKGRLWGERIDDLGEFKTKNV